MLGIWGKLYFLISITLISLTAKADNSCMISFQQTNLTSLSQSLKGNRHEQIQSLIQQSPHWLEINLRNRVVSQIRYRVWEPKKSKVKKEILLIGGLGQSLERFDQNPEFMKRLIKAGIRVVFIELPGQGHTSLLYELENGYMPNKIPAKQLFEVIDYAVQELKYKKILKHEGINLMGHSYGGWLITQFLVHHRPSYVNEVMLLDPGLKSYHNEGLMQFMDPLFSINPFYKPIRNKLLGTTLKYHLKKDVEHYQNDNKKLNNAVALYLGIMNYNSIKQARSIPEQYNVKIFLAENTEFGSSFKTMIKNFFHKLITKNKRLVVLKESPHNIFLFNPAASQMLPELLD